MKVCGKCKEEKPLTAFTKKRNGLQPYCSKCNAEYKREWYKTNKQRVLDKNTERRVRNQQYIRDFLSDKECSKCGESDTVVLEFDHLRDKVDNVCEMARGGVSLKTLQDEIEKCEILCCNCHRRKHYEGSHRYI